MARSLHRAGLLTAVWNRTPAKTDTIAAETGVAACATPQALAGAADVIVVCVSADADVRDVVDRLMPGLRPGQVVVDSSTIAATTARELSVRL